MSSTSPSIRVAEKAKRLSKQVGTDPDEIRETLRIKCRKSLYFLSKAVLGYRDLTPDFHRRLCYEIQAPEIRRRLLEVPRAHLKTTIATRSKPLWRLIQEPDPPRFLGFNDTMLLCMSGGEVASIQVQAMERQIETNDFLRWLFPELVPEDYQKTIWNTMAFRVGGAEISEPNVQVAGVGSKVTGLHVRGIIEDDLIDETVADSQIEVARRISWHQYAFPLLTDPSTDWIDTIGNRWGKKDLNGWIRENEPDCKIMHHKAILPDGTPLWPERFNAEELAKLRIKLGGWKYSCQYLNDPKDPEAAAFKSEWLRYYEPIKLPDGRPGFVLDNGEIIPRDTLWIYMVIDPAQTAGNRSDRTGVVVTGVDPAGRILILTAQALRLDPNEAMLKAFEIYNQERPGQVGVEAIAFQRLLVNTLERIARARMQWMPVRPIKGANTAGAKEARINQIVGETFASGRVHLRRDMADFIDEYSWFPDPTATRDLLDAFALSDNLWVFSGKAPTQKQMTASDWAKAALKAGMNPLTGY